MPVEDRRASPSKGERTRRAVLAGTQAIINEGGTGSVSQEAVAKRAGISQSAVRHYYPTKEGLLAAAFNDVLSTHRVRFERIVLEPGVDAGVRLARVVHAHLDSIVTTSDSTMLEVFAFWTRNEEAGAARRDFHRWMVRHYADWIRSLRPDFDDDRAKEAAFQVLTLTLGAWLTLGRSRPHLVERSQAKIKEVLMRAVDTLVGVPLPW
jgi:AcrR family transcriptional regulator